MKKLLILIFVFPFFVFAQNKMDTTDTRIVVTEDVNECVQKIYDNPDAIKLLMTTIMSDKQKMKQLHQDLMNDPEMQKMMRDMRNEMKNEMRNDHMHHDMNNQNQDPNEETPADTTGEI